MATRSLFADLLASLRDEYARVEARCRILESEIVTLRGGEDTPKSPRTKQAFGPPTRRKSRKATFLVSGNTPFAAPVHKTPVTKFQMDVGNKKSGVSEPGACTKFVTATEESFQRMQSGADHSQNRRSRVSQQRHQAARLDDVWTELFIMNRYEAEDELEALYLSRVKKKKERKLGKGLSRSLTRSASGGGLGKPLTATPAEGNAYTTKGMLLPQSQLFLAWGFIGMVLIVYDMIMIPYSTAWSVQDVVEPGKILFFISVLAALFWNIDLVLNFFTAIYINGDLITDRRLVAINYLRSWFSLDLLLVCMDLFFLMYGARIFSGGVSSIRLVRMITVLRISKFAGFNHALEDFFVARGMQHLVIVMNIIKIFLTIIFFTHFFTCALYFVGQLAMTEGRMNWIEVYKLAGKKSEPLFQYARTFHWILCQFTPAPNPWLPQNNWEQGLVLFIIIFSLPVVGSCIARMNAAITLLNAKRVEREQMKRQLEQYLKMNEISVDLSSRILRCAAHVLLTRRRNMQKPAALNLLPNALNDELAVAQIGRKVVVHPLLKLISDANLNGISEVCQAFTPQSFEPNEEIFLEGTKAQKMYVISKGSFHLYHSLGGNSNSSNKVMQSASSLQSLEELNCSQATWFAEPSLFTRFMHNKSLVAVTFSDCITLVGADFAKAMRISPVGIVTIHEYAVVILKHIESYLAQASVRQSGAGVTHSMDRYSADFMPVKLSEEACQATQLAAFIDGNNLNSRNTASIDGAGVVAKPSTDFEYVPSHEFVRMALAGEVADDDMISTIEEVFQELDQAIGIYSMCSHMDERKRVLLALSSCFWLVLNKYEKMVASHANPSTRLTRETWAELQAFVMWAGLSHNSIHAVLVFLTIRGLGKSRDFVRSCPPSTRRQAEYAVVHAMEELDMLPSVKHLNPTMFEMVRGALNMGAVFNFSQLVQGENIAQSVRSLQNTLGTDEDGQACLKFYLFALVCMMCGLTGTVTLEGSLFLTEQNARTLLLGIHILQNVQAMDACTIYWSYIASRAHMLGLPYSCPEQLAVARVLCITRTQDEQGVALVRDAWERLGTTEREALVDCFLADGLDDKAFLFTYLPLFFANATKNPSIGLYGALIMLLKILERLEAHDCKSATMSMVITVDLNDVASIVMEVRSMTVLDECIDLSKMLQSENQVSIVMTSDSWQAASDKKRQMDAMEEMARSVKYMRRRQDAMETSIDEILVLARLGPLGKDDQGDNFSVASEDFQRPHDLHALSPGNRMDNLQVI